MLILPELTRRTEDMTLWQDYILTQQSIFRLRDTAGPARTSIWGLACSPLGDLIATASSIHPSTEPVYLIGADYTSTLIVKPIEKGNDDIFELPINADFEASKGKVPLAWLKYVC
jgi:hypothetical protein